MDPYSTSGPRAARNRIFHWRLKEWLFLFACRLDCRPDAYCVRNVALSKKREREKKSPRADEKLMRS